MTEVADIRSVQVPWWRRLRPARLDDSDGIDFAELVWIHQLWRKSFGPDGTSNPQLERRYREALDRFQAHHGRVVQAYWCSEQASGAVLTVKPQRLLARLVRRPPRYRFHRLTDWTTKNKAEIAELLHQCDALAVKSNEILRGTTQRITMELIMSSAAHVLGLADEASAHDKPSELRRAVRHARTALEGTRHYYEEVALREAQIVYFWGMIAGFAAVAALAAGGVAAFIDGADRQLAYVTVIAGAIGAIVSVLMRVTKNTFVVDADLGRKSLRRLGSFRPVIGAVSGLAVYVSFRSGVLTVQPTGQTEDAAHYFFALLAFLGGFSERFAKDVLDASADTVGAAVGKRKAASREPAPEEPEAPAKA